MAEDQIVKAVARTICPYGWRDDFWNAYGRVEQFDRNQRHVQENAMAQARDVLALLRKLEMLK